MSDSREDEFYRRYGVRLEHRLGFGHDGAVMFTDHSTAVKLFDRLDAYRRERNVYQLLQAKGIERILGHNVPLLIRYDDELRAIEMEIVEPPYLIDFGAAYPEDEAPDFPPEVWDEWAAEKAADFGDRWADVVRLRDELCSLIGVILMDVNPGNITFPEDSSR